MCTIWQNVGASLMNCDKLSIASGQLQCYFKDTGPTTIFDVSFSQLRGASSQATQLQTGNKSPFEPPHSQGAF